MKEMRKKREVLFASVTEKLLVRCSVEMQLKRVDMLNNIHAYVSQPRSMQVCGFEIQVILSSEIR